MTTDSKTSARPGPHPFGKDLNYLFPFLERVAAYADSLPEPQAARLRALVEGEGARWAAVKALLDGEAGEVTSGEGTPSPSPAGEEASHGWAPTPINSPVAARSAK